jgi:tetratricopeptide (TPR) repeat protein
MRLSSAALGRSGFPSPRESALCNARLWLAVVLGLACFTWIDARASDKNSEAEARATYNKLVDQFVHGGANEVSLRDLRLAAAEGRVINDADAQAARAKINSALTAKQFDQALQLAMKAISHDFTNMEAHFDAHLAYQGLGNEQSSQIEEKIFRNLVASILESGNGKSAKTAWFVVATREEYIVVRVLGYRATGQDLKDDGVHYYDVLHVVNRDGGNEDLWFNVDTDMKKMHDAVAGKK